MNTTSDRYEDVARTYIRVIKRDSLAAGTAIEQIHIAYGGRAALRATLTLTLLKMSVKEHYRIPDLSIYGDITKAYPEALPLLRHAIICCCLAWGVVVPNIVYPQQDKAMSTDIPLGTELDDFGADLPNGVPKCVDPEHSLFVDDPSPLTG